MPDIPLGSQVFDVAFHPNNSVVLAGLLTGQIAAYSYDDDDGAENLRWQVRPTKRSCRGLAFSGDGQRIYSISKDKSIYVLESETGNTVESKQSAHDSPINRITFTMPNMLATGDDDGVVKLWDTRQLSQVREYKQHFDFISDFLWLEDKKHLVATSGDGTLSVIDVRSNKTAPFAHSEDQEDELLSIVPIKGGQKVVVGTQLGVLSIFNRKSGWKDCVDRVPGHPQSIDALVALTSDVILTGSSDGLIRAVQILPSKLLGAIADHDEFPVERLALDRNKHWLASASHDETLKLTDVKDVLEDSDDEADEETADGHDAESELNVGSVEPELLLKNHPVDDSEEAPEPKKLNVEPEAESRPNKRKKKQKEDDGRNKRPYAGAGAFFDDL